MFFINFQRTAYSFLLIAMISVCFTSCSKEELNPSPETEEISEVKTPLLLPNSLVEQGEAVVEAHLKTASQDLILEYRKEYILSEFLAENEKQITEETKLEELLSNDQLRELETRYLALETSKNRGCVYSLYAVYTWETCYRWSIVNGVYVLSAYRCRKFSHWACCILKCD